jgi:hypothetical protein
MTQFVASSHRRRIAQLVAVLGFTLGLTATATGAAGRFPVPRCGWVPPSLIDRTFHVNVRARAPVWTTQIAPVLTCALVERKARYAPRNINLVTIQFRELQRFKPPRGWTFVRGLGRCVEHSSCPAPHRAAYVDLIRGVRSTKPYSISPYPVGPYAVEYTAGVGLRVEDGLNSLTIFVTNLVGPLPLKNEVATVEKLARKLLPRFYWP